MPTTARRNPGEVTTGDWAHVKWNQRQHLVTAVDDDPCQPVRFACGQRSEVFRVWHDPALPHLPKCRRCEKAA